jgi:Tol biopolymer transport system component
MFNRAQNFLAARLVLSLTLMLGMLGINPIQSALAATLTVTNTSDSGPGSLRQAIEDAAPGDTITFDSSLGSFSIIDLHSPLLIEKDLTIDGSNLANPLPIDLRGASNIQILNSTVVILNLIIQRGYNDGNGGAIWSNGDLTLFETTIKDSYTTGNGGGVYSSGTLTIQSSTIHDNGAGLDGGGIYAETDGDQVQIANSTIAENQAEEHGGGVYTTGSTNLSVVNSTIAQNGAGTISQLMSQEQSQVTLSNSIAACWFPRDFADCYSFAQPPTLTNSILGAKGQYFGLGDLADNGGPTKTMAIAAVNSPLIDAGSDAICAGSLVNNWDQRSTPRPQGSHCDIGAYELIYRTVSGNAGVGGAVIRNFYDVLIVADNSGNYSFKVLPGWSGAVIPSKLGYSFTPAKRTYTNVQTNKTAQNYSVTANAFVDPHAPRETWRVSVANDGGEADGWSDRPSISGDGRYVAYTSQATNIVPGDWANDILVYDNQTGQTTSVSVDSDGTPFDCNSESPSISADGRYVAFTSCYQGSGAYWIAYVYDRHTGTLESAGRGLTPSISGDGRYVAYLRDDNQFRNIFVNDLITDHTTEVSRSLTGGQPNGNSFSPMISTDGRYVAFYSAASNLVNNDTNGVGDVFVYDLQTNERTRVSVRSNGAQANAESFLGSISGDGRYIVFGSAASNLVNNDTNGLKDVFVHDRQTGETTRISISTNGTQGNGDSTLARVSTDGRYVAFRSLATNLISGDTNGVADIFMHDRQTGETRRISVGSDGLQANGASPAPGGGFSISANGKYLAFSSDATNLVATENDTNAETDVFIHETACTCVNVSIGGELKGGYEVPVHASVRQSYARISGGPVKIEHTVNTPFIAAERVIYKVNGVNTSFSEMMGLPDSQLNTTYWLPWYNNVDLDTQLRFANVSASTATVYVSIGGQAMAGSPFTLAPGASMRKSFAGINAGPVEIVSDQDIVAAERVIYKVNDINTSFSEMLALPDSQLDTIFWLPWYNNKDLDTQLRIANVSDTTATVNVYIGGTLRTPTPITLAPGASMRKSFAGINGGPVKIVSDQNIVAAERVIYKVDDVNTSFTEMMALPDSQLDTTFWLPWYNNKDLDTQLRFANVTEQTATVHVYIGGVEMPGSPFTLAAGVSTRRSFPGINSGPVQIVSDQNIVAAERVIYKVNNVNTSFSEMMALPNSLLDTTYWFPWYNNQELDTQLRFGVP